MIGVESPVSRFIASWSGTRARQPLPLQRDVGFQNAVTTASGIDLSLVAILAARIPMLCRIFTPVSR